MSIPERNLAETITHTGTVTAADAARGTLTVRLDEEGECGGCPAAKICSAPGSKSREVSVQAGRALASTLKPGARVTLAGTEMMHRRAIMLATVIPCLALIAVMTGVYLLTLSQTAAALSGLGAMVLFFGALYLCRNRIAHEFVFRVTSQSDTMS